MRGKMSGVCCFGSIVCSVAVQNFLLESSNVGLLEVDDGSFGRNLCLVGLDA
jgi:hypothetical protein